MENRRRRIVGPIVGIGVAILGAAWILGYAGFGWREREAMPEETAVTPHEPGAVAVTIQPVQLRQVQRTVETVGTLHAFEQVVVSAKVEGRVRRILHDVGDRVRPGDLLLEIDPTDFDLSVRQAERALDVELAKLGLTELPRKDFDVTQLPSVVEAHVKQGRAKERYDRVRALVERNAVSRDELSNITSDFKSLGAEYENQILMAKSGLAMIQMKQEALSIVRQQLKDTRIEASHPSTIIPSAARDLTYAVTSRTAAEGSFLRIGTEVFKLVIDRLLKLKVPVPDRYVADVKTGQKARVMTAAYDREFEGTVTRINPSVDSTTRTFEVEIQVPNADGALKSGSFAKAAILTRFDPQTPTVPLESIVRFAGITKIFLVENGKAKEVQVTPGVLAEQWVEIVQPKLPSNAQVITSGQSVLADGTPVFVRASPTVAQGLDGQTARK